MGNLCTCPCCGDKDSRNANNTGKTNSPSSEESKNKPIKKTRHETDLSLPALYENYWKEEINDIFSVNGIVDLEKIKEILFDDDIVQKKLYENTVDSMYEEAMKEYKTRPLLERKDTINRKFSTDYETSATETLPVFIEKIIKSDEKLADLIKDAAKIQDRKIDDERKTITEICEDKLEINELFEHCHALQRIQIMLKAYHRLIENKDKIIENKKTWTNQISMCKIIEVVFQEQYQHLDLVNDFCHINIFHINPDNKRARNGTCHNIAGNICKHFEQENLECDIKTCFVFPRHYGDRGRRQSSYVETSAEDIVFQQECDKIHNYFFHSTIKFGTESYQTNAEQEDEIDKIVEYTNGTRFSKLYGLGRISSRLSIPQLSLSQPQKSQLLLPQPAFKPQKTYVGKREDNFWWKDITPNRQDSQSRAAIYRTLVENIGIFRYQNPHGFGRTKNQAIQHYVAKHKNIKEEALHNMYAPLSKDSWNQTLRKAEIFSNSFAKQRIKTKYNDFFEDQVTGHTESWKAKKVISLPEIVTLKLYTDFDKLQFQLKKCFRFETTDDILTEQEEKKDDFESSQA
eukprot:333439_1